MSDPVEQRVREMWEAGRAEWPGIDVPIAVFAAHLAAEDGHDRREHEVHAADLYLACACVQGDPGAIAAFDRGILQQVPARLARQGHAQAVIDDVLQGLRIKLLLGAAGGAPRLAAYRGRGALLSWVSTAASRDARNLRRNMDERPKDGLEEGQGGGIIDPGPGPEVAYLRARYSSAYIEALRDACAGLSREDRALLRLRFIERLSTPEIGARLGVHHTSISRRLARVERFVRDETQRLLRERLRVTTAESESIMTALDLAVSISGLLRSRPD